MSDSGTPFVLTLPEELAIVQTYDKIASKVVQEVDRLSSQGEVKVKYDPQQTKVIIDFGDGKQKKIDPFELRQKCICAACVDEFSGVKIMQINKIPKDVYPTNMLKKGNYAVAVVWSDGHKSSIYPYERLKSG